MVWLFGPSKPQVQMVAVDDNHDLSSSLTSDLSSDNNISRLPQPMIALDEIKQSGLPIHQQIAPYLQMDPSVFQQATPEYVMPVGTTGKGKFEFALGNIGWGVIGGYSFGCMRGFLPEFFNRDTKQLRGKPWVTRMVNATVKHGSGYAQPAGAIVVMYSLLELILRKLRADDDLNSIGEFFFNKYCRMILIIFRCWWIDGSDLSLAIWFTCFSSWFDFWFCDCYFMGSCANG